MPCGPKAIEAAQVENASLFWSWATTAAGEPWSKSQLVITMSAPSSSTLVAASPASSGFDFMSAVTVSIWRPSIPPSALMSSIAKLAEVCAGTSNGSMNPVSPIAKPRVSGSSLEAAVVSPLESSPLPDPHAASPRIKAMIAIAAITRFITGLLPVVL